MLCGTRCRLEQRAFHRREVVNLNARQRKFRMSSRRPRSIHSEASSCRVKASPRAFEPRAREKGRREGQKRPPAAKEEQETTFLAGTGCGCYSENPGRSLRTAASPCSYCRRAKGKGTPVELAPLAVRLWCYVRPALIVSSGKGQGYPSNTQASRTFTFAPRWHQRLFARAMP